MTLGECRTGGRGTRTLRDTWDSPEVRHAPPERTQQSENGHECALQAARRPDAKERPHHDTKIARGHVHPVAFGHIIEPAQPGAAGAARLAGVREASFDKLTAQPTQSAPALALRPLAVRIEGCLVARD